MEKIVDEEDVGANRWRRTGVYFFSGDPKSEKRMTFSRLQKALISHYNNYFSYGTVVELCVATNKRRGSSLRHKGVAQIQYRRATKGFTVRLNPDRKWSRSLYTALGELQCDGKHILLLNRDDQAGFRLDTTYTHKSFGFLGMKQTVTTKTDFINKYQTLLQTTSYNFSKTKTTPDVCLGVVKASFVHQKSPAQHISDLEKLEETDELKPLFLKPNSDQNKDIECIGVDGATDEGPSHMEVQFLWTERHFCKPTKVTLVTTCSSGDSFLNRVELQNGCLARGHSNLFIPSTINGLPFGENGEFSEELHKKNMELALQQYIQMVDGVPCMNTTIKLVSGCDNNPKLLRRSKLLTFLCGTKKARDELKESDPQLFTYFQMIWAVKERHTDKTLPSNYIFLLRCCGGANCPHPLCKGEIWFIFSTKFP